MISVVPAVVAGTAAGAGIAIAVAAALPGRSDLGDVLARLDASRLDVIAPPTQASTAHGVYERIGSTVLARFGTLGLPRRELEILRESPALWLGRKVAVALYGLMLPLLGGAVLAAMNEPLSFTVPGAAGLVFAAVFWFLMDVRIRQLAAEARLEFRVAVASYLELVGLERAADAGPTEALKRAAAVGDGWVFERIRDALLRAELAGIAPWDGLRHLSQEIGVPELGAPADIIAVAGEEGASVHSTLQAQARSLRGVLLTDQQAQANTASEKMVVPVAALVILMTVYIAYPAIARIINS
ncbi:type II secretion system F family protein [Streptacidiphilus rugosus]|uniref:type II secretion system F family protein n=1 Tax=Streptacidiphilus rugosus TaxID=405783 RepID=UPI00068A2DA4|nr:type II secretion system F family protein [Streptacidiphilus rugosus]